ncbi:LA_0442/LA_0875 N-terminal domain-containing protein [Leptospira sp. GIMC2001]|uniref:LA_0442/LA_0875 N-terminal domain-containing protein n=1 Tax=Leptospira sp. GIMC2001 TaxID=1513297 RepID=UPI00234C001B|nr:hypothetical protein [Leptospira sp. GIMC2001]WCL50537.1 hypothetical protein O4O04_06875 [Leptospira sp. GIMC2001]
MIKNRISSLAFILLLTLIPVQLFAAHSVILKNGKTVKGLVVGQNENGLTVKLADGSTQNIAKTNILKVVYKDVSENEEKQIRVAEEKKLREKELKEEAARKKKEEEEAKKLAIEEKKRQEEQDKLDKEKAKTDALAKDRVKSEGTRSKWSIVWRSAVLPSWGLYHAKRPVAGTIYTGLFYTSILFAMTARSKALDAKSEYDTATLIYQATRPSADQLGANPDIGAYFIQDTFSSTYVNETKDKFKASVNQSNAAVGVVGLIYFIQLAHSYFAGVTWVEEEFMTHKPLKSGWELNSTWEQTGLAREHRTDINYTWRF